MNCKTLLFFATLTLHIWSGQRTVAQNLVPNGSFEPIDDCPVNVNDLQSLGWQLWLQSPNCFNECSPGLNLTDSLMDVALNGHGYQPAYLHNGYIGLLTFGQAGVSENYREYAGCALSAPLVIDTSYYVSFRTCLTRSGFDNVMNHASNNIGVIFTQTGYDWIDSPMPIPNEAHLYASEIIEDTTNWTLVEGVFVANDIYSHIGVGNFFDSDNTEFIQYSDGNGAYYYVDDVVVMKLSDYNHVSELNAKSFLQTIEQGSKYICSLSNEKGRASLFDLNGKQIWTKRFNQELTIDLVNQSYGIYLLQINIENKQQFNFKLIKS